MLLGVHCSVSGGVINAFSEAERLGIDTFQIFTKNQRQWKEKQFSDEESENFKKEYKPKGIRHAFSHATYLINLGSIDEKIRENSIVAMAGELARCDSLGLDYTVVHPGAAKGCTSEECILKIADALNIVLEHAPGKAKVLLENTAGQGSAVGYKFEHLRSIMDKVNSNRVGVCFDTCHAFAAGYDIRTKEGFETTMTELDRIVGLDHLKALHLNDSKAEFNSRVDRHEHIGHGKIGLEPFKQIMKNFTHIPKVIETPKVDDWDEKNLDILRQMA